MLRWLNLCPGKNVDRCSVDMCILENAHIIFPDLFRPLVRVVISSVEDSFKFGFHCKNLPFLKNIVF